VTLGINILNILLGSSAITIYAYAFLLLVPERIIFCNRLLLQKQNKQFKSCQMKDKIIVETKKNRSIRLHEPTNNIYYFIYHN